jgi:hypothetical protein
MVNGPNRPLPLTPRLEILSHERLPVRIRLRYEKPISDSEDGLAGLSATLDINHLGVFARLYIVASTFDGVNEFVNIMWLAAN